MKELNVIGTMSGTSLDGLDVAAIKFSHSNKWEFEIIHAKTYHYNEDLRDKLKILDSASAFVYEETNHNLGRIMGGLINEFISESAFKADFIASHGHTVFHQPQKHITTQIGHPAAIQATTQLPVVADFRTTDVHLGGQGAPLVPIGDLHLFPEYSHCLNLGGIANVSIKVNGGINAFDVCVANMALNYLARKAHLEFDESGKLAASGKVISPLVEKIIDLEFHSQQPPKSLGKEWFDQYLKPLLDQALENHELKNVMCSMSESIATLISQHISPESSLLITGGGAFNTDLISRLESHCNAKITVPSNEIIGFKEALIFGFLGVLRWIKEPNILSTVTGVERNHIGGCIYA